MEKRSADVLVGVWEELVLAALPYQLEEAAHILLMCEDKIVKRVGCGVCSFCRLRTEELGEGEAVGIRAMEAAEVA